MIRRIAHLLLFIVGSYTLTLCLFTLPFIQREFIFLNHIRAPFFVEYAKPERYGLAPFKTRNLYLNTSDGETIGAWHILPHSVYREAFTSSPWAVIQDERFEQALAERPTVLYFHGNSATRAQTHRVRNYGALSTTLDCNVLAIDYRGFGESTGIPSELGLLIDARTVWDYAYQNIKGYSDGSARPENSIIVVGHSLGTAVAAGLAGKLADEDVHPRAIALIAPFSSLPELLLDFRLFQFIPLLSPLRRIPAIQKYLLSFLQDTFHSSTALQNTHSPILILHADDDWTIHHLQSASLFESFIDNVTAQNVIETNVPGWGTVSSSTTRNGQEAVWWKGLSGGHNDIGWAEGTIELIRGIAHL